MRRAVLLLLGAYAFTAQKETGIEGLKLVGGHGLVIDSNTQRERLEKPVTIELYQKQSELEINADDIVHSTHFHKVEHAGMTKGRGTRYVATVPIARDEEILSIPLGDTMSIKSAKDGRVHLLVEANPHLPSAVILALHLLEEKVKGTTSKWHSFISTLPYSLHSTIFLSEDDHELIQGSHLARLTDIRSHAITDFFNALETPLTSNAVDPPIFTPAQFTLQHFKWAMAAVWAHSILIPQEAKEGQEPFDAILVPYISTLTPCDDCSNRVLVKDGYVTLVAGAPHGIGDQIGLQLGPNSYALHMLNHGFTPASPTSLDVIHIGIQVESTDPLLPFKQQILSMMNISMDTVYTSSYGSEPLTPQLLQSMRAKVLISSELEQYQRILNGSIVSLRNEHAVCRALYQTVQTMLGQYAHPPSEVNTMLSLGNMTPQQRELFRAIEIEQSILVMTKQSIREHWDHLLTNDSLLSFT